MSTKSDQLQLIAKFADDLKAYDNKKFVLKHKFVERALRDLDAIYKAVYSGVNEVVKVEVPVEKIVEVEKEVVKIVEVPVEKIVDRIIEKQVKVNCSCWLCRLFNW